MLRVAGVQRVPRASRTIATRAPSRPRAPACRASLASGTTGLEVERREEPVLDDDLPAAPVDGAVHRGRPGREEVAVGAAEPSSASASADVERVGVSPARRPVRRSRPRGGRAGRSPRGTRPRRPAGPLGRVEHEDGKVAAQARRRPGRRRSSRRRTSQARLACTTTAATTRRVARVTFGRRGVAAISSTSRKDSAVADSAGRIARDADLSRDRRCGVPGSHLCEAPREGAPGDPASTTSRRARSRTSSTSATTHSRSSRRI